MGLIVCVLYTMMMSCFGRYNNASFLAKALLSALFLVVFQQSSSFFVAATARRPAASLNTHAIATDGGPRDFTAPARKAWVAETTTKKSTPTVGSQSSSEEVAQLGAGGNYFVHSSCIMPPGNRERRDHVFGQQRRRGDCVARIRVPRDQEPGFRRVECARARVQRRRPQRYRRHRVGDRIEQSIL